MLNKNKYIESFFLILAEKPGRRSFTILCITTRAKTEAVGVDMQVPATSDTYITQGAPGSPLVVGASGCEGLLPTLGACVHHPLLPQTGLQSFAFGQEFSTLIII